MTSSHNRVLYVFSFSDLICVVVWTGCLCGGWCISSLQVLPQCFSPSHTQICQLISSSQLLCFTNQEIWFLSRWCRALTRWRVRPRLKKIVFPLMLACFCCICDVVVFKQVFILTGLFWPLNFMDCLYHSLCRLTTELTSVSFWSLGRVRRLLLHGIKVTDVVNGSFFLYSISVRIIFCRIVSRVLLLVLLIMMIMISFFDTNWLWSLGCLKLRYLARWRCLFQGPFSPLCLHNLVFCRFGRFISNRSILSNLKFPEAARSSWLFANFKCRDRRIATALILIIIKLA